MANLVKLKRGSGSDPSASDMVVGEPVLRTDTAELFFKKDDGTVAKVAGSSNSVNFEYLELRNAANDGSASYPNANFTLVEAGTTTAVSPTAANTMLVSVNGVIQKPNTGTSAPSQGFAIDGSTIKFGANLIAAPNFILYQEAGGIGEPSNNSVSTNKIVDDAVTYAKIQNVSATDRILGRDSSGAGVIEEITPANLRTMLNVADGATNVTNNNQISNGAGYITATLTNEQVQDIVGGMVTGNTETGITVTYQDGDGTLDFVVGTLNQDTTGNAATATALETARTINGVSFDGSANITISSFSSITNSGTTTFNGTVNLAGNTALYAGGSGYIRIIGANGGDSFIDNNGGTFYLAQVADNPFEIYSQNNLSFKTALTEQAILCSKNGSVALYHDGGNKKFETSTTGATVTGTLTATTLVGNIDAVDGDFDGTLEADAITVNGVALNTVIAGVTVTNATNASNADTVDTLHATSFLRSDAADTATGLLSLNGGIAIQGKCSGNVTSVTQSSGNITFDFSASTHHKVELTQNATFLEPSNQTVGQSGSIFIKQPSSGNYTGSFHSSFKFQGGTQPTLSTSSGMVDRVDYVIYESSKIHAVVTLDYQ